MKQKNKYKIYLKQNMISWVQKWFKQVIEYNLFIFLYIEEAEPPHKQKKRNPFTVAEIQIIQDNYNTMSVKNIAAMLQGTTRNKYFID